MGWNQTERLEWLKRLTKRTPEQQMIVDLSSKVELSNVEKNLLSSLWAADRLKFKSREAERKTAALFCKVADSQRKRHNHAKICIGIAAMQLAAKDERMTALLLQTTQSVDNVDMDAIREVLHAYGAQGL